MGKRSRDDGIFILVFVIGIPLAILALIFAL